MGLDQMVPDWLAYFATAREEKPAARPERLNMRARPKGNRASPNGSRSPAQRSACACCLARRMIRASNPLLRRRWTRRGRSRRRGVVRCLVGAMLKRAGLPHSGSLAARSYLQWGKAVAKPYLGLCRGVQAWQGLAGPCCLYLAGVEGDHHSRRQSGRCRLDHPYAACRSARLSRAGHGRQFQDAQGGRRGRGAPDGGQRRRARQRGCKLVLAAFLSRRWLGTVPWLLEAAPYLKSVAGWLAS